MNDVIKEITKVDKQLLDKIEYILSSELNCEEYDKFYNYFNEIKKPNILIDIKDDENIKDYITNLQQENERLQKQLEYLNQVKWERNFNETMNKELKTRIEKAVKYIDIYLKNVDDIDINIAVVKDILNGRSDE